MHRISRISLTIDRPNAILAARLYGLRDPAEDPRDLIDHLAAAGEPWLYDILLDFRRFEADLTPDAMAFLIRKWIALEEGCDRRSEAQSSVDCHFRCCATSSGRYLRHLR
jgi:hypothetical protein